MAPSLQQRLRHRLARRGTDGPATEPARATYGALYEAHAQSERDDAIGGGDYDVIGEIELDALRAEGLEPTGTLLDFGCGNGRLAVHAVPYLQGGTYIGTDIAPTFLAAAARRIAALPAAERCTVRLLHQTDETFALDDASIDVACAYSVFTHMEHEDMHRYLVALRRVVRPGGRLVLSCLPMSLEAARHIFLAEAALDPAARWTRVRNVTTSTSLVDEIAALAGWTTVRWRPGDQDTIPAQDGTLRSIGQSIVVLTH